MNFLHIIQDRFAQNESRHPGISWADIGAKLSAHPEILTILEKMEETGGEPDVVALDRETGKYVFYDCSPESPAGRRSLCYDRPALDARKENKPKNNVKDMAQEIGAELLNESEYRYLQTLGQFDQKTSSWIDTPANIRDK